MNSLRPSLILLFGFFISISIFFNGFLMNRSEIHEINSCPPNMDYCQYSSYKRVVILLVDALKFEFIDPTLKKSNYYHGNIDVLSSLRSSSVVKSIYVNHFTSDPPTTTLQRIKGLTTGSLPTFIDISSNFGSSELIEDNIINRWNKFGFDIKFVGDDTWNDLFPQRFNKSVPYPSFNVKDLDTVDRAVETFILDHMSNSTQGTNKKPEILIGHLLGVDHCGHIHGKNHPEMKRKLTELNDFLKKVVALMDKETLVVMFGDHGMTASGDHGGESAEEVDAALLLISGKTLNFNRLSKNEQQNYSSFVSQIDFVPTLAAITGVALPFSNLGVLRPEMLTSAERVNQYLQMNVAQVSQYVRAYEEQFGSLNLPEELSSFLSRPTNETFLPADQSLSALRRVQTHFRAKWAQFNLPLMAAGVLGALLNLACLLRTLLLPNVASQARHLVYLALTAAQPLSPLLSVLLVPAVALEMFLLLRSILARIYQASPLYMLAAAAFFLLPFSNSYIVHENAVVRFLVTSLLLHGGLRALLAGRATTRRLATVAGLLLLGGLCLWVGAHCGICREEQRASCSSEAAPEAPSYVVLLVPAVTLAHRLWLRRAGNLADKGALNAAAVRYGLPLASLSLFLHQCLQSAPALSLSSPGLQTASIALPRLAMLAALLVLAVLYARPLLMLQRRPHDPQGPLTDIPSVFRLLRARQAASVPGGDGPVLYVHGLATIYSSLGLSVLLAVLILLSVLLKPLFVAGLLSAVGLLVVFCGLWALQGRPRPRSDSPDEAVPQSSEAALVLGLLCQTAFFASGHQSALASLPWYAAFQGHAGDHGTRLLPGLMVFGNLFCGHLLLGTGAPLLSIVVPAAADHRLLQDDHAASAFLARLRTLSVGMVAVYAASALCSILSAAVSRRHLMAWKIFVPKLIFSVTGFGAVSVATVLGYLFARRVHLQAVRWRQTSCCSNM